MLRGDDFYTAAQGRPCAEPQRGFRRSPCPVNKRGRGGCGEPTLALLPKMPLLAEEPFHPS